MINQFLTV